MNHARIALGLQPPLDAPDLPNTPLQQPGGFGLRPSALQHWLHDLQSVPITLTHLDPVSIHQPPLDKRTLLLW
jgi:hypothetical protein